MLLRSSSTPILSSIIKAAGNPQNSWKTSSTSESHHKISFPHDPSLVTLQSKRIRLVNSEDNLIATPPAEEVESENDSPVKFREPTTKTWCNKCKAMTKLERTPSFTLFEKHGNETEKGEVKSTDDEGDAKEEDEFSFPLIGDGHHESRIEYNGGFSFFKSHNNFFHEPTTTPMYLALGLGSDMDLATTERRKLYDQQMQRHYEIILRENPCNPLILRNFARYLYKVRKDYTKAEELYTRAIVAEPNDGEVQSEYAKLRWEVNGDKERASDYFARSVQASSQNSHVLAAYASFLWGTEETEDEGDTIKHHQPG